MKTKKIWGTLHPFLETGAILGRRIANRDFLRAFLNKAEVTDFFDAFHFFLPTPEQVDAQTARLQREFPDLYEQGRLIACLSHTLPEALSTTRYYCFHLSDPFSNYPELIRLRNRYSCVLFPVTAPTHSLSYRHYGERFLQHIWSGVSRRDAVVATSRCGQAVVTGIYDLLRDNYRLDKEIFPSPHVPVIPLGVMPDDFPDAEDRNDAVRSLRSKTRADLGILSDQTAFLTLARISYHSKMDLLPLLQAFKRAEAEPGGGGSHHWILAGWEDEDEHFGRDVEQFCRNLGISCSVIRRPDDATRKALYAAADVFVSPSDNVQETFGLTLLEAAVSSLPVIASDYDGYRDLVCHEETGVLIPSLGPSDTGDVNVRSAAVAATEYHLRLAQQCVVDVKLLGRALARLGADKSLRLAMGEKGRRHALCYSWSRIIERYLALWRELNAIPIGPDEEKRLRSSSHPAELNYGRIFSGYCSASLDDEIQQSRSIQWSKRGQAVYRGKDFPVFYSLIEDSLPMEGLRRLLLAARKSLTLAEAREVAGTLRVEYGALGDKDFLLLWALKHDLLEFVD